MKRSLTQADILSAADYEKIRTQRRGQIMAIKKRRRVAVGPCVTFYFENFETMWLQVQEMLRIEKGGAEQLLEELHAYNPLIPDGRELVATIMFEIADPMRRQAVLSSIGGVEKTIELRIGNERVTGKPEKDLDYTSADGKASSVQFVHFPFTAAQVMAFRAPGTEVVIAITHPHYGHMAVIPGDIREELMRDFG